MEVDRPVDDEAGIEVRRRPVKRLIALALLLLVLVVLLVLWLQRKPIAADFLDRELARRNVHATYEVKRIGFRTQRLENLVIGDPRHPDLVARWVEVRLQWRLGTPRVTLITARGVRLNARLANGRISMGEVDRLLPPPSGLPFRLPDQAVDVADATIRFDTPAGRVGIALEGKGNLADGFRGRMAAAAPVLRLGACRIDAVKGLWNVGIADLRPAFRGPAQAGGLACGDRLAVSGIGLDLDVRLAPALDRWRGSTALRAARLRAGSTFLTGLAGRIGLDGDARMTRGALDLQSAAARVGGVIAARARLDGRYGLSLANGGFTLLGDASARGVRGQAPLAGIVAALGSAGGTPIEPVADSVAAALARAGAAFDADAALRLVNGRGYGGVRFERLSATARSGARVELSAGQGLTYYWPSGLTRLDGRLDVAGGGFPTMRFSLDQPRAGAPVRGTGRIQPMRVGNSRLALGDIASPPGPAARPGSRPSRRSTARSGTAG
jgi:translocation and assembly module TamB